MVCLHPGAHSHINTQKHMQKKSKFLFEYLIDMGQISYFSKARHSNTQERDLTSNEKIL